MEPTRLEIALNEAVEFNDLALLRQRSEDQESRYQELVKQPLFLQIVEIWKEIQSNPPQFVKVEVRGGVAEVVECPKWIKVEIEDLDSQEEEDDGDWGDDLSKEDYERLVLEHLNDERIFKSYLDNYYPYWCEDQYQEVIMNLHSTVEEVETAKKQFIIRCIDQDWDDGYGNRCFKFVNGNIYFEY